MDASKKAKCPICGYDNPPGTLLCVRCYSLIDQTSSDFALTTIPQTGTLGSQPSVQLPSSAGNARLRVVDQLADDSLALFIDDFTDPIIVPVVSQAVLGRYTPNNPLHPLIDLTSYGALEKGVSRMHIIIRRANTGLIVEDMASSNGTALNDLRLAPYAPAVIRPGDRLRLGKMEIEIYFNEAGE
jgi:hypothetical protein